MERDSILQQSANEARGLAIDAIAARRPDTSAAAGLRRNRGGALRGNPQMRPRTPPMPDRDRFILSAGHGSMFLYSWLHISGYGISAEDLANFGKKGSNTPGPPRIRRNRGRGDDDRTARARHRQRRRHGDFRKNGRSALQYALPKDIFAQNLVPCGRRLHAGGNIRRSRRDRGRDEARQPRADVRLKRRHPRRRRLKDDVRRHRDAVRVLRLGSLEVRRARHSRGAENAACRQGLGFRQAPSS